MDWHTDVLVTKIWLEFSLILMGCRVVATHSNIVHKLEMEPKIKIYYTYMIRDSLPA